jgi:putative peptidoglycan lipid II flippase
VVVGLGTALSRATGFVRLAAVAYAIGFTRLTDTYNLANTTPNIVYELLLGGILSAALVPIFVEHADRGDRDATSAVVSVAVAALAALTVVGLLAAPAIVRLYTLRLEGSTAAAQQALATDLLRLLMPQMFFYGVTALATALLNARRSFAAPAYVPVLNNLLVSGVFFALPTVAGATPDLAQVRGDRGLVLLLGLGTTAGIVTMALALWPAVRRAGVRLQFRPDWRHPAVRTVVRLSGWTMGYAVSNQLALWVVLVLANAHAGGVSAYQGAYVFFQLPHGLVAVSLMTTVAPDLALFAGRADWAAYRERFRLGLALMGLAAIPAAVGYLVLARPIVSALLERGAFSGASAELTGDVLTTFAVGLVPFSLYLYALRGFYTLKDTKTPFLLNAGENALNVALALALEPTLGVQGLALAYSIAYGVAAIVALGMLSRRVGGIGWSDPGRALVRAAAASVVMAGAVALVAGGVGSDTGPGALTRTAVGIVVGGGVYAVALVGLGGRDVGALRERRRAARRRPGE